MIHGRQIAPILALALLPTSAAHAFGDMDCVSLEICRNDACAGEVLPMNLRFDWPNQSIALEIDMLADDILAMQPPTEGETRLAFTAEGSDLTLDYTGGTILATYTRAVDGLLVTAQCEAVEAA